MRECLRVFLRESVRMCTYVNSRGHASMHAQFCAGGNVLLTRFHMQCIHRSQHPINMNSVHARTHDKSAMPFEPLDQTEQSL